MKLRLSILLLAAALAAAPAAGQTVKSLGYNTTNGFVTYSGSNSLTFTNSLQFSTNAQPGTRTNLGGTTVGNAVFTATNAAAAATAIGLGTANEVTFGRVAAGSTSLSTNGFSGGDFAVTAGYALTFVSGGVASTTRTNLGLGATWLTNTDVTNFRTAIGLGATNNVTFSNITASGTLAVTGNVTMSGTDNLAPSQTTNSASSLMTRDLSDDRYRLFYVPLVHVQSSTAASGSTWNLRPFHSADAAFSVPPWARNVRINLSTGFTNAPITNNFTAVITAYQLTTNSFGAQFTQATNALSVTQVYSNGSNSYRFILRMTNDLALPSDGISDAESASFWNILIQLRNNSSGSLTTVADNWLRGMAVFSD